MSTQHDINAIRAQRLANTHNPLALMVNTRTPFHSDQSSLITYIQHPQSNKNFVPQHSFNTNYMPQPMRNPKDISDPTTALDMALKLMSKAFQLNNITPTNNNQRSSSNPCYSQIAQLGMNIDQDRQMLMVDGNVGNQFKGNAMHNVGHLHGNGNVVAAQAKGNSNEINGNQIRCYNCRGKDGSAEVHHSENCYDNDIFNMFTQEEQYTELLEPIPELHQVQQNDSNVISTVSSVKQSRGTVEKHPVNVDETHVLYDSLYNNLAIKVEKVNSVNRKLRETNTDLTSELARYKNQEKCFEINQEKYDKLERCYQKYVYQEQCLTKKINALHLSSAKQITTLNEEIANLNNQLSKEKSIVSFLQEGRKKLKNDFKTREDELLDKQFNLRIKAVKFVRDFQSLTKEADESLAKHKALELEIERLLRAVVSQDIMSIVQSSSVVDTSNLQTELKQNAYLKTTYKNLFDSIKVTWAQTKAIIDSLQDKLHDTIYENAKLRAQLFDKFSEQKDTNKGTSVNTQLLKQSILGKPPSSSEPKLYSVTPFP
ncbi:hypothetical protein Tco_1118876 [Tanacetum coccineum]